MMKTCYVAKMEGMPYGNIFTKKSHAIEDLLMRWRYDENFRLEKFHHITILEGTCEVPEVSPSLLMDIIKDSNLFPTRLNNPLTYPVEQTLTKANNAVVEWVEENLYIGQAEDLNLPHEYGNDIQLYGYMEDQFLEVYWDYVHDEDNEDEEDF